MSDVSLSQPGPSVTEPSSPTGSDRQAPSSVTVLVRYFAAARAAAGSDEEPVTVAPPATVSSVIDAITGRHGDALTRVLDRCSYLLGATAVHELSTPVGDGDQLDVLPPFAGG